MEPKVRPIADKGSDFRRFLEFPYRLHRDLENWIPVLRQDVEKLFDRDKNPFFEHADLQAFVAERPEGGRNRIVGRIVAIENTAHNEFHEDRVGFFGFFDCEEDPAAATALFDAASGWLAGRRLDTMRGPANFSSNDDLGLLVRGFHRPPAVLMPYNPPYYEKLIEDAGFSKAKDLLAFYHQSHEIPEKLNLAANRVEKRVGAKTRGLDMSRFEQEVETVRELYNVAWEKNWGFVPMTRHEIDHMAKDLKPVVAPELVRFVEIDGKPVGFTLALPDLNQVLAHLGGNMGPWEILKFLWYRRKVDGVRVLTLGLIPEYRSMGLDVLMYRDLFRCSLDRGIWHGEFSWVLEDNIAMCRPLERMGATVDRVYRLYDRSVPLTATRT
jgi:hypothetical protein